MRCCAKNSEYTAGRSFNEEFAYNPPHIRRNGRRSFALIDVFRDRSIAHGRTHLQLSYAFFVSFTLDSSAIDIVKALQLDS